MEDQDRILLSSLRSLGYPIPEDASPDSLDYVALVQASTYFLKRCGIDADKLPKADQMKQRYRVTSMIVGELRSQGMQVEVSIFLSPSGPDIRNFLLSLLGKSE
jgi:hypothetical protein